MKVTVVFYIKDIEIKTVVGIPNIRDEEGQRVMAINHAIDNIKKNTGLNIRNLIDDVYISANIFDL